MEVAKHDVTDPQNLPQEYKELVAAKNLHCKHLNDFVDLAHDLCVPDP